MITSEMDIGTGKKIIAASPTQRVTPRRATLEKLMLVDRPTSRASRRARLSSPPHLRDGEAEKWER